MSNTRTTPLQTAILRLRIIERRVRYPQQNWRCRPFPHKLKKTHDVLEYHNEVATYRTLGDWGIGP